MVQECKSSMEPGSGIMGITLMTQASEMLEDKAMAKPLDDIVRNSLCLGNRVQEKYTLRMEGQSPDSWLRRE